MPLDLRRQGGGRRHAVTGVQCPLLSLSLKVLPFRPSPVSLSQRLHFPVFWIQEPWHGMSPALGFSSLSTLGYLSTKYSPNIQFFLNSNRFTKI